MVVAKCNEKYALTAAIETKGQRVGELAVEIVQMQNDLSDTEASLIADKQFLAEMDSSCKTKTAEWEERVKTRGEELAALAETIKVLNDDSALDLFKKTLPSASFMQVQVSAQSASMAARKALGAHRHGDHRLDL